MLFFDTTREPSGVWWGLW